MASLRILVAEGNESAMRARTKARFGATPGERYAEEIRIAFPGAVVDLVDERESRVRVGSGEHESRPRGVLPPAKLLAVLAGDVLEGQPVLSKDGDYVRKIWEMFSDSAQNLSRAELDELGLDALTGRG